MWTALSSETIAMDWSVIEPEGVEPSMAAAMNLAQAALDGLLQEPLAALCFENTFLAFEESLAALDRAWARLSHYNNVCQTPEFRKAYTIVLPQVSAFYVRVYMDTLLWERLHAYAQTPQAQHLDAVEKRFIEEILVRFQGAKLSEQDKLRLLAVEEALALLTQKYAQNVLDALAAWEYTVEASSQDVEGDAFVLRGVPKTLLEQIQVPAEAGLLRWRITLQEPIYGPIMQYAQNAELRKQLWEAKIAVGRQEPYDNRPLVPKIIALRQQKAQLLGYETFAHWALERRMVQTPQQAQAFVQTLHTAVAPYFEADRETLEALKAQQTGAAEPIEMAPWDVAFLSRLHEEQLFDPECLRPYFPLPAVQQGFFDLCGRLFGFSFHPVPEAQVWHPDVQAYALYDAQGKQLGLFYTDWFPRPQKRAGAWMTSLTTAGYNDRGQCLLASGVVSGNLSAPHAGKPALLTHDEVCTVFHEFGHLLHHLVGSVPIRSLNGIHVAWDFVELPSQFFENFCWEVPFLESFAKNFETGEKIPCVFYNKLLKLRTLLQGAFTMRQLSFSKMDLEFHSHGCPEVGLDAHIETLLEGYQLRLKPSAPSIVCQFQHLFADPQGYAAGYYAYQWAEVLDADVFACFKGQASGIWASLGQHFLESILSKGNSEAPEKLFKHFMGRPVSMEAYLERKGFLKKSILACF